jgi:hypothetical protein
MFSLKEEDGILCSIFSPLGPLLLLRFPAVWVSHSKLNWIFFAQRDRSISRACLLQRKEHCTLTMWQINAWKSLKRTCACLFKWMHALHEQFMTFVRYHPLVSQTCMSVHHRAHTTGWGTAFLILPRYICMYVCVHSYKKILKNYGT